IPPLEFYHLSGILSARECKTSPPRRRRCDGTSEPCVREYRSSARRINPDAQSTSRSRRPPHATSRSLSLGGSQSRQRPPGGWPGRRCFRCSPRQPQLPCEEQDPTPLVRQRPCLRRG